MLVIPEEGFSHPDFQKLRHNEALDFFVRFDLILDGEIADLVNQIVEIWISELKKDSINQESPPLFAYNIKPESLRVVLANIGFPLESINALKHEFQKSPLEIIELFIRKRKFSISNQNKIKLEYHIHDSRIKILKSTKGEFWEEKLVKKLNRTTLYRDQANQYECEMQPIYINGLIVSYGIKKCRNISNNRYSIWFANYLEKYLKEVFGSHISLVKRNDAAEEKLVQMIHRKSRVGYLLEINHHDFLSFYGKWYRVRDYELLQVFREIVRLFRFSPVVHWERDNEKYKIQLWENWTY